jgi:hypothetical protein
MIVQIDPRKWFKSAPQTLQTRPIPSLPVFQALPPKSKVTQEKQMAIKSVLDKIGAGFKDVFDFLGSPKGQVIVGAGESLVEVVVPGSTGFINLLNKWGGEIIKSEALATAAGAQTGSGPQKAAMVLSAVAPQAIAFAQANGLPAPTAAQLTAANTALVAFANAFTAAPPAVQGQ